jgi:hypothetical protein
VAPIARTGFQIPPATANVADLAVLDTLDFGHAFARRQLVFVNGRFAKDLSSADTADGVYVRSLREVLDPPAPARPALSGPAGQWSRPCFRSPQRRVPRRRRLHLHSGGRRPRGAHPHRVPLRPASAPTASPPARARVGGDGRARPRSSRATAGPPTRST